MKAEPPPTRGVSRDSGTDSDNGGWLRRLVRRRNRDMTKKNIYNRTHRHRAKNKLKNPKAVRAHKRISGRTGGIWAKRNHSTKRFGMILIIPNVPTWWWQHL